jgi:hypothetical protein
VCLGHGILEQFEKMELFILFYFIFWREWIS